MAAELQLQHGCPCDRNSRIKVEIKVYELLDSLGITYDRVDHEAAFTMEACEAVDRILEPAVICKNLFLCNTQKTKFYLLMIPGDKKFKTKDLSHQINSARLSFAPEEYMEKYLFVAPGSVSVMGLMNDHDNQVMLLIDEDLLQEDLFACHPCINTSSIRFKMNDLLHTVLPAIHHEYMVVHL